MTKFFHKFFTEYIFYLLILLFSAQSANFLENKIFLIVTFIYSTGIFFYYKKKIERPIDIVIILWITINLLAYFVFGNAVEVKIITFLSITARMILPYYYIKLFGKNFFYNMEKIIFFLALISLPLFFVQYLNPSLFYSFSQSLNAYSISEQQIYGGWYVGFYMFNGWAPDRNSGFMWEPGAFAFMVIIAMLIRLSRNQMKFDKYMLVYILAIITTFSTMGYIVLLIILVTMFIKSRNVLIPFIIMPLFLLFSINKFSDVDFLLPKIEKYSEEMNTVNYSSDISGNILRMNRFGILTYAFNESIKWPFGYGIFEDTPALQIYGESVRGPNTYAQILLRWGWIGLILFLYSAYLFIDGLFHQKKYFVRLLIFAAFLSSIFSYSLLNNSILLAMLYYPYINKKVGLWK